MEYEEIVRMQTSLIRKIGSDTPISQFIVADLGEEVLQPLRGLSFTAMVDRDRLCEWLSERDSVTISRNEITGTTMSGRSITARYCDFEEKDFGEKCCPEIVAGDDIHGNIPPVASCVFTGWFFSTQRWFEERTQEQLGIVFPSRLEWEYAEEEGEA